MNRHRVVIGTVAAGTSWARSFPLLPVLFACMAVPGLAADLQGTVTSATLPTPISGAIVTLRGGAGEHQTTTDAQGAYRFTDLERGGRYSIEVVAQGFRPFHRDDVRITADPHQLDVSLELTNVLESVVVEGTGKVLSLVSNSPDVSLTVTRSELAELPSNSRSVIKYALLDPHVRQTQGLGGDGNDSNRLSINAASYRHTAFVLDGVINYDWVYANGPYQIVSATAVDDMRVISNQFAAEYGTSTSGVVVVSTRTGTNNLSGEAFAFLRPSGIQAKPPLTPFEVPNKRTQWGAQMGGPLVRDKTFFFASYEGVSQQRGAFIQSPTPGFFTGDADEVYGCARIDHNFTPTRALSLRMNGYHYQNTNANDRVSGFNQPNFGRMERSQSWGGQLTYRTVTRGVLNFARVNYSAYSPDNNGPSGPFSPSVGINRPGYSVEGFSQFNWDHVRLIDVSDMVAFNRGRHSFKVGAEVVRTKVKDFQTVLFGTYRFANGPPQPGERPVNFAQTFGTADLRYDSTNVQAFAQDDFRISPRLSANLGLRYEYQTVTDDHLRFSPRVGLAWDPKGDGKTRLTAGFGVFYDSYYLRLTNNFERFAPHGPQSTFTIPFGSPGFPTFPNSLGAPPAGADAGRLNLFIRPDTVLNPRSLQYSAGVEQDLGDRFVVSLSGIYSNTRRQYRANDLNHPAPFIRTVPGQRRAGAVADATRPMTTYQGVPVRVLSILDNGGHTTYSAVDVGIRRKYSSRVRMEAHYVLASSDTNSMFVSDFNSGVPNEWNDWEEAESGPTDFYQKHRFVGSASVDLPHGVRFATIATIASGLPVNPLTGVDNNGDTLSVDRPVGLGRNSFRTPKQASVDASLSKQLRLSDQVRVEGRVEVFNALNHNNFINVNNIYGDGATPLAAFLTPIAGIRNSDPSRQIQFLMRLMFARRSSIRN
jgi:hypothetical protein